MHPNVQFTKTPWGNLPWLFERIPVAQWQFLGAISPEPRYSAAWKLLTNLEKVSSQSFLAINPVKPDVVPEGSDQYKSRLASALSDAMSLGIHNREVSELDLLCHVQEMKAWLEMALSRDGENIALDISVLPKRFFFPILQMLLKLPTVRNLLVTYTSGSGYPSASERLATNVLAPAPLPLFGGRQDAQAKKLYVSSGFESYELKELINQFSEDVDLELLLPLPPGPPHYSRVFDFMRPLLEPGYRKTEPTVKYISAFDVPDAFDHFARSTSGGMIDAAFAPYGPKPLSLAICLFAQMHECPVLYSQPRLYSPDYTTSMVMRGDSPEAYGYLVIRDGKRLYDF